MQTCIAEHRALWLGSWRTWFFGFLFLFFFQCWLAGYCMANKAPVLSQPMAGLVWILLPEIQLILLAYFILKLRWWLPALLITTYSLINLPHCLCCFCSPPSAILHLPFFLFPSHLPFFPASTHPAGRLLVLCLIEGGMALTSTAEQKQPSYLRGFLAASELLIHHVSSLFCSGMQQEVCHYSTKDHS